MKIGSDVPEVTWMALRCVFRLGIARPSTRPMTMARMIQTGRNRSSNDRRAMTGASGVNPPGGRSETTSLTAGFPSKVVEGSAARVRGGSHPGQVGARGAARCLAWSRRAELSGGNLGIGEHRVDLPRLSARAVDPHLVLHCVAA